ncbi:MAG: TatD family hydrolase [Candidatus Pacebacteria bacterium]|jgi:TatD DNase family protein|nr:TatD family hydrolase [Candidatus Paceibacterota bacterium]
MEKNNLPEFVDVHAHVQFNAYEEDRDEVIKRSLENKTWMINVGTNLKTSKDAVALTEKYPEGVFAIVGLHPIHTSVSFHDKEEIGEESEPFNSKGEEFNVEEFEKLISHPKVVGVGECGLDFFRIDGDKENYIEKQTKAFESQIDLAVKYDKPLMIHCREAYPEVLKILTDKKQIHGDKLRGNFHFFAGTLEEAQQILDLGFNFSFTGVITFASQYEELVKMAPLDRIFSETDCPYVTPAPFRGKRNEPAYVSEVVKKIAEIKEMDTEAVRVQILKNAINFFSLN